MLLCNEMVSGIVDGTLIPSRVEYTLSARQILVVACWQAGDKPPSASWFFAIENAFKWVMSPVFTTDKLLMESILW